MRISDWSSDVCSSDLQFPRRLLDQAELGKFAIQLGRQIGEPVIHADSLRRIATGQITPPLMRALRLRMNALEARHTDDIDAPVAAILEPQNLDARDKRVLDDEMQLAADQLVGALGLEPRRETDLAGLGVVGDPRSEEHTSELQ